MIETCSISDCNNTGKLVRGWCKKHYRRWQRFDDPLTVKHIFGVGDTPEQCFWSKVNKDGPTLPHIGTKCWEWTGYQFQKSKYGQITFRGKVQSVHRLAWFLTHGKYPDKLARHICNNRICVNPSHLIEGTHKENYADAVLNDSNSKGEKHGMSKLTDEKVRIIRQRLAKGDPSSEIAKDMGVSPWPIYGIKKGITWTHVS